MIPSRWKDQCEAALRIREGFGFEKALGYLVGEKFLNLLPASDYDPALRSELPTFAADVKAIFTAEEIARYLATVRRVGAAGHVLDREDYELLREAGAFGEEDVVSAAQRAILLERARLLLLGGGA